MIYLKEFNYEDALIEYDFFNQIPDYENGFVNPYHNMPYNEFYDCIERRIQSSKGINLKEKFVPDTYYFLYDNDRIVGLFKVRHYLNDFLRNGAGHIGYIIHPLFRRQGYGTKGLALAIEKLIHLPDFNDIEIYLSCYKTNTASFKVIQNNGGYIHHEDQFEYYLRIKV